MVIVSHPTGNRNVNAILAAFERQGLLAEFSTSFAVNSQSSWLKLLPANIRQECLRRSFSVPNDRLSTFPLLELSRMVLPKLGLKHFVRHEQGFASVDAVYRNFDRKVAKRLAHLQSTKGVDTVYAYEDGALETFKRAKQLGMKCIYDLPIAYWETGRQLMKEEAERLPDWAVTLGGGILDSEEKLERKTAEMELADVVVGPGKFVLDSIPHWAKEKKTIMSPFGSPELKTISNLETSVDIGSNRPLRILFVGSMGQRKGLGDLFEAINILKIKDVELVVMGSLLAPIEFYKNKLKNFTYEPGRPHDQVLELMRSCDVFCLPSIVEGRALVMQEAMSQGLPLIITHNTGGADLIKEGETGFLVPIRSPEVIAEKINWFVQNRSQISEMGKSARNHAAQYTWGNYGDTVVNSLRQYSGQSEFSSSSVSN